MATKKPAQNSTLTYQSNPFSLSFDKFGLFFENNLGWAIALIVLPIITGFLQLLGGAADALSPTLNAASNGPLENTPLLVGIISLSTILVTAILVAIIAISVFITGLFTYVALENDAGRKANFSKAIDAVVARFWRLFTAQLLATVKVLAWSLLLIIPGIIAAFRYTLLPYVIMDESAKAKGIKKSHDRVKELVKGRKREVFGVYTVALIIPIVGSINQIVGNAALYRQLQVFNDKKTEKPPIHWLNYFGFILMGFYLLLILFIIMLAVYSQVSKV